MIMKRCPRVSDSTSSCSYSQIVLHKFQTQNDQVFKQNARIHVQIQFVQHGSVQFMILGLSIL